MPDAATVATHPWPAPSLRGERALFACLDDHLGIAVPALFSPAECASFAAAVYAARAEWTPDFGGEQFSLGRAFYTHLEQDRARHYFAGAAASDALVERCLPGLQARVLDVARALLGGEVRARRGWCGPGVHVFPASEHVALHGGVIHFDLEGLTERQIENGARAVTLVIMLQPAERGGGLRLWDIAYEGDDEPSPEDLDPPGAVLSYGVGDLGIISSYRLHQIEPFSGARDRISITAHAACVDDGLWDVWF